MRSVDWRVILVVLPLLSLGLSCNAEEPAPQAARVTIAPSPEAYTCESWKDSEVLGGRISYIQLVTDTAGWALIDGRLDWTDDGGMTWRDITPPDLVPRYIGDRKVLGDKAFFVNDAAGWLVAVRPGPEGLDSPSEILIWRTADAGRSWLKSVIEATPLPRDYGGPPSVRLMSMDFIDPQRGWLTAMYSGGMHAGVLLFTSSDGGATWSRLASLQGLNDVSQFIRFANARDGWWMWGGDQMLHVTHDGGETWEPQSLERPGSHDPATRFRVMHVDYGRHGGTRDGALAATSWPSEQQGAHAKTAIYVTGDGGASWSFASFAPGSGPISMPAAQTWLVGSGDKLYETVDAGKTWTSISVDWSQLEPLAGIGDSCSVAPLMLSFADSDAGWAVVRSYHAGARDIKRAEVLVATSDGGATWRRLHP